MEWGIVASVVVAVVLLIVGLVVLAVVMFGLMARGIKKKVEAGGTPTCPIPGCPMHKEIEKAQAKGQGTD